MRFRISSTQKHGLEIDDAVLTVTEKEAARLEWALDRRWLGIFWWMVILAISVLGARVFFLNVVHGAQYREMAKRNSIRSIAIPAPRGKIYDRFGVELVRNIPSVNLVVTPADLPESDEELKDLVNALRSLLQLNDEDAEAIFAASNTRSLLPVVVKDRLSQDQSLLFRERGRQFPGFSLVNAATRSYTDSVFFSHLLGYEGKIRKEDLSSYPGYFLTDSIGKQGLEKSYESDLRGVAGANQVEVDSLGQVKKELGTIPPRAGSDLMLNIDADLQKKIQETLQAQLEKAGISKGAAVALDPRTGAVLAMVSLPSFDNNLFAQGIETSKYQELIHNPDRPLFNRASAGEYPPASTIKPILAAAGLQEGNITEQTQIESRGGIQVGSFFFGDWKVHGFTDVRRAIAVSSDVFFYALGGGWDGVRGLGMETMKRYEELFGWGKVTGVDLPGEADGFLPTPQWKREKIGERWYVGDDYNASIGQGFVLVTPLQIVNAIAAIANGGTLYRPQIVSSIRHVDGRTESREPEVLREAIVDPNILRIAREGMRQTVTEGTAQSIKDLPVQVAGKTGTAQFGNENKTHGWFVSFAPYDRPEIAMIVLAENQMGDKTYNTVPVTHEVYQWYFTRERK